MNRRTLIRRLAAGVLTIPVISRFTTSDAAAAAATTGGETALPTPGSPGSPGIPAKTGLYTTEDWQAGHIIDPRVLWLEFTVKQVRAFYRCSHAITMTVLGPEPSQPAYRYMLVCTELHACPMELLNGGFLHYLTVPREFFTRGRTSTPAYHTAAVFPAEDYDPEWATA